MEVLLGVVAALFAVAMLFMNPGQTRAAEIRVVGSVAMKSAFDELLPVFNEASGDTVAVEYGTAASIKGKIDAGTRFDIAITPITAADDLIKSGHVMPDPHPVVGVAVASLAYRTGTPKPDVSTDEAFKTLVSEAPAISLSDPALGGASSNYFMAIAKRLGIDSAIKSKLILTKPGEGAAPVGAGTALYGAALTSEIAAVPGVSGVPIFPADPDSTTTLVATIASSAEHREAARAFIAFLLTPQALAIRKVKGLVPD